MDKKVILIVEDSLALRDLYIHIIKKSGHLVFGAPTLADARQMLSSYKFDLVLLDMRLPDGSGIDLIPWVQEQKSQIIVLSAEEQTRSICQLLGIDFFLSKPVANSDLRSMVERVCKYGDSMAAASH